MGKKYLLYIHQPDFEKEAKKSELVEKLLADYYDEVTDYFGGKELKLKPPILRPNTKAKVIKATDEAIKVLESHRMTPGKTCKHGNEKGFCFSKQADKDCK